LTGDIHSDRAVFCKDILDKIGFDVEFIIYTPHENRVISNKLSMHRIYELIISSTNLEDNDFVYFFEDDINWVEPITLDEIIEYEKISSVFFYLGICQYKARATLTDFKINNHKVYKKQGNVRGTHAFGISKSGAKLLLDYSKKFKLDKYMDMILEDFSVIYPANVVRYDLSSIIRKHRGIIFQDRTKFKSIMNS
jgi:GR25 family glycosyltransferase involved in LPS biosynthesis